MKFKNRLHWGYYILAAASLLLIVSFSRGIDNLLGIINEQKSAYEMISLEQRIMKNILLAETGLHGYIINREINYLRPYEQGKDNFTPLIEKTKLISKPPIKGRIESIETKFSEWLRISEEDLIYLGQNPDEKSWNTYLKISSNKRKSIMESIKVDSNAIEGQLIEKLKGIEATVSTGKTITSLLVFIGSFGSVSICFILAASLLRKTQQMEDAQEAYMLALDGSYAALWDWDVKKNSVYYSPRWKAMLGYTENEIPNLFSSWENLIHPDDKGIALKGIKDFVDGTSPVYELPLRMKHKDGEYRTILTTAAAIRDNEGRALRIAGSHLDLTESRLKTLICEVNEKPEEAKPAPRRPRKPAAPKNTPKTRRKTT
jgi:PAS domain S-box-containing protein